MIDIRDARDKSIMDMHGMEMENSSSPLASFATGLTCLVLRVRLWRWMRVRRLRETERGMNKGPFLFGVLYSSSWCVRGLVLSVRVLQFVVRGYGGAGVVGRLVLVWCAAAAAAKTRLRRGRWGVFLRFVLVFLF